jgi:hypothetical protein
MRRAGPVLNLHSPRAVQAGAVGGMTAGAPSAIVIFATTRRKEIVDERKCDWPLDHVPDDHPALNDLGL